MRRTVLAVAALVASIVSSTTAFADATPVQLMLLYVADVSNSGTPAASGIAELVMPEGEVRLAATGLPKLEGSNTYVLWLVNSTTNQHLRLGSFNANDDGAVRFEDVLPDAIPNKQWNLLLVTVESGADVPRPGSKRSIAGMFPRSERDPAPALLPNTGGADDMTFVAPRPQQAEWLPTPGLAALTLGAGLVAGYGLGLKRR
jgi:hypothetical protein